MQQSDALALADEEDEEAEHAKGQDEMVALKQQIREMLEEKRQRDDYQSRLVKKIAKLNAGLADVVEEEEGLRRKQDHERRKKENESLSFKRELGLRKTNQENRIRGYLSDVLYTKPPSTKAKQLEIDTVKVMNRRFQHPLAFRVDDSTTVMKLRNNACKYWNVVPDDFILKTMANNKCSDEIRVKDCFKQGELAQLRLEEKKMEPSKPSEEELKAILPKNNKGKGRKSRNKVPRYNAEGIETIQKHIDSYASQLRKMGGIYHLLKLRDTKPSEHCAKIKLRDVVIYTVLCVLSVWVYLSRRPGGQDYWLGKGVLDPLLVPMPRSDFLADHHTSHIPGFEDVRTQEEVWEWLSTTLPAVIWNENPFSLGAYNLLVGYMSIRVKNVVVPGACEDYFRTFVESIGGACYATSASGDAEGTAEFPALATYWESMLQLDASDPQRVRGTANPGVWVSAETNRERYDVGTLSGLVDRYSGAGYSAHYKMDVYNQTKAKLQYHQDMGKFREAGWISLLSRVVILSFTTYNFDYDMWVAADFLFEMPPTGAVKTYHSIQPFKPRLDETRNELAETSVDVARIIIAIYILVFVGMNERRHKIKYHKAGAWYHVLLNGVADYGVVVCIWVVVLWRNIGFRDPVVGELLALVDGGYRSFTDLAVAYNSIFCVEGLMMIFLALRFLSFLRLNHTIYLFWHTLGNALTSFGFVVLMFVPALVGFTLMLYSMYGGYLDQFANFELSLIQMYRITLGQTDATALLKLDAIWGAIFLILFYVMVSFMMLNIFAVIVIDAYYVVQVTGGGPGEQWEWRHYYKWVVPGLLVNLMQAVVPSSSSAEKT